MCICEPGYEGTTLSGSIESEADGEADCQPKTFPWCDVGQQRLASGVCADIDCDSLSQCPTGAGVFLPSVGICSCRGAADATDVCGATCRATQITMEMDSSSGMLVVTDSSTSPPTTKNLDPLDDIPAFTGSLSCTDARARWLTEQVALTGGLALEVSASSGNNQSVTTLSAAAQLAQSIECDVFTVQMGDEGFLGVFGVDDAIAGATAGAGRRLRQRSRGLLQARQKLLQSQEAAVLESESGVAATARAEALQILRDIATLTASDLASGAASFAGLGITPGQERWSARQLVAEASTRGEPWQANATADWRVLSGAQRTWARLVTEQQQFVSQWVAATTATLQRAPGQDEASTGTPSSSALSWARPDTDEELSARRHLQTTVADPFIARPVACLHLGQSFLWTLGVQADGSKSYPVYEKDSYLNSNPAFDYGPFRQLAQQLDNPSLAAGISLFGYTFSQAGTYVFSSSTDKTAQMIVKVVDVGQQCPAAMQGLVFQPTTSSQLAALGVAPAKEIHLEPNWDLLVSLLVGLFVVITAVVGGVYVFRRRAWGDVALQVHSGAAGESKRTGTAKALKEYQKLLDNSRVTRKDRDGALNSDSEGDEAGSDTAASSRRRLVGGGAVVSSGDEHNLASRRDGLDWPERDFDSDDEPLDVEDEDLRNLIRQLQEHHEEVVYSFREQQDNAQRILDALHEESDELRRLIAARSAEMAADSAITGEGGESAKQAAVLRQMEGELHGRSIASKQMERAEADIQAAIEALAKQLQNAPARVATLMVGDLLAADPAIQNEDTAGDAVRALQPEASTTAEGVRAAVETLRDCISRYSDIVVSERKRREEGLPVWRQVAGTDLKDKHPKVVKSLDNFDAALGPLDTAVSTYLQTLRSFASGSTDYLTHQRKGLRDFLGDFSAACDTRNPAVKSRVQDTHTDQLGGLVTQLHNAVEVLRGRLPSLASRVRSSRESLERSTKSALAPIAAARQAEEDSAKAAGMTPVGLAGLSSQLQNLIETLQSSMYVPGMEQEAGHDEAVDAYEGAEADGYYDSAGMDEAAAELVAAADRETEEEARELNEAIAKRHAAEEAEFKEQQDEARRQLMERLNDPELTDEERQRLLADFERDQAALLGKTESERRRQDEDMKQRLEERRQERLRRKLKRAEGQAAEELERRQGEEAQRLDAEQAALREAAELEEEDDIAAQLASARAAGGDDTFDVESAMRKLKDEFDSHQDTLSGALHSEKGRQRAHLQQKLRERRQQRQYAAKARRQAAIAAAGTDYSARAAALKEEVDAVNAEGEAAKAQVQVDRDAQVQQLTDEMQAARNAWRLKMDEYDAQLAEMKAQVDDEEAARKEAAETRVRGKWKVAADELLERQQAEIGAASQADLPSILARHAGENAKLGADRDAELAAADAEIEAAAAAARAQLEAEESKLRLASVRREAEWQQALQQGIHDLRRAAVEGELNATVETNRGSREAGLLAKQASELAAAPSEEARAALAKKHAAEMEELQRALNKDEAELLAKAELDAEEEAANLEAQLERLRKEFERNSAELEASVDAVRKKQTADVKAKLAQRRARRMQSMRRRQQEETAAASNADEAAALAAAHAAEKAAVEGALDENDDQAMAAVEATHKLKLAAFDADAELAKLHKAMEKEAMDREDAMHKDKRRQRADLQRKLRERKAKKMSRLRQKQMEERAVAAAAAAAAHADASALAALAAIDQRHAEEISNAEEDADELATAEEAQLEAKLDVVQKQYELDFAKDQETVQEQFAVLRSQADDEAEHALQRVHGEKNRQTAALETRLRARKRRKMRALQRQQAAERAEADMKAAQATSEQQAKVTKEVLQSSSKDDEFDSAVLAAVRAILGEQVTADELAATGALKRGDAAGGLTAALASVLPQGAAQPVSQAQLDEVEAARVAAAAEAERAALAAAQEEERLIAEEAAQEEERAHTARMAQEKEHAMQEKRNELAARLAAMNVSNQEQFEAIRAQQEKELEEVEARLDEQQRSQSSKLKKRLAERKARKARTLARKHAAEMASTAEKETEQLKALKAQAQAGGEVAALQQMLAAGDSVLSRAKAGEAVEALLRQRHTRETNDMLAEQYAERSRVLRAALQEVLEDKAAARSEVSSQLKDAGASEAEVAVEMTRLEEDFAQVQSDAEKRALESMEVKHAKQQMSNKQRQLGELAAMLKAVAPDDKERLAEAERALQEAQELLQFQENMQREREERNARAEADRHALEVRLAEETAAELAAQEAEMEESLAAERRKAEARMEQERERLRLEADALRARTMEAAGKMNDEEKQRVLAEFETAQARKEERQERQRDKQKARLAAQLAKRKERALRKAEAANRKRLAEMRAKQDAEEAKAAAEADAKRKAMDSKKAADSSALQNAVAKASGKAATATSSKAGTPAMGIVPAFSPASSGTPGAAGPVSVGGPQLQALQGKLSNIEKLLATLKSAAEAGGATVGDGHAGGAATGGSTPAAGFVDPASRSTPSEGALVAVPMAQLNSSEQARMKIGQRLLHSVGMDRPPAGIALAAASSLPHDEYTNNAYRNTYYFDDNLRTLHIRRGRFLSTGDFMLVLAHAAAHISVGSMSNDGTAAFQAEFHRLMRAFGQEMYTPAPAASGSAPSGAASAPPATMRGSSTVQAAQAAGLEDEEEAALDSAAGAEERAWQAGSLPDRLAGISSLSKHAELQQYLASLEGDVLAGDDEDSEEEAAPSGGAAAAE